MKTETTKERIKLHKEAADEKSTWQHRQKTYIEKCARCVGGYLYLALVIGKDEATVARWRKGAKIKLDNAIEFESKFNDHMEWISELRENGETSYRLGFPLHRSEFRACRFKIAAHSHEPSEAVSGFRAIKEHNDAFESSSPWGASFDNKTKRKFNA